MIEGVREHIAAALWEDPIGPLQVTHAQAVEAPSALGAALVAVQDPFAYPERLLQG